ncbi:uncharacterized protein LOC118193882 [Stegodyphus dumicola]|uniref:uncharacterized protein LOC118193882 n=1 Tax=Stegodyphus dumicola TaxID=202533 RepID=UPI0015AF0834|nr:uncharacterized protein LOC118193882 [Stegodyphus dumicola]
MVSETYGSLLCPILLKLIPSEITLEYSRNRNSDQTWNVNELMEFIRKEIESCERATQLNDDVKRIMMLASFNMRKWRSNNAQLHAIWNAAENTKFNGDGMNSTLLGYIWNHEADKLKFRIKDELLKDPAEEITKRKILQVAGELYDPIGFISPFVVAAKMMMQECWQRGYQWDAPLDQELQNRFKTWYNEIPKLKNVEIPRHYFNNLSKDSSQKGYGAVVYLRYNENELTKTSFVMSKARVAPIKRVTLPRLKLLGAVIGARLMT